MGLLLYHALHERPVLLAEPQIEHLHEEREGHREVDVALGHVLPEALRHEHDADEQEEGERQDLHARMALDEAGHRPHREEHHHHRDDHGHHHDGHVIGHADGGDDGVEREDDVEEQDLHEHG